MYYAPRIEPFRASSSWSLAPVMMDFRRRMALMRFLLSSTDTRRRWRVSLVEEWTSPRLAALAFGNFAAQRAGAASAVRNAAAARSASRFMRCLPLAVLGSAHLALGVTQQRSGAVARVQALEAKKTDEADD